MSVKFIYNNNHQYARCLKTGRKHIVGRDYSGHSAVICDMCKKEIYGLPPFSISITDSSIIMKGHDKTKEEELSTDKKKKIVDILTVGNRTQSDYCNSCVGQMEDWRQKLRHKAELRKKTK